MSLTDTGETAIPADELKKAFAWTQAIKLPKPVSLGISATIWLEAIKSLRRQEAELLADGNYKDSLSEHRVLVCGLIAEGERIVWRARKFQISKFPSDFTLADLESALKSLRVTFRCEHEPQNTSAVNAGIQKLLNGS
jgi:hypothetical protein